MTNPAIYSFRAVQYAASRKPTPGAYFCNTSARDFHNFNKAKARRRDVTGATSRRSNAGIVEIVEIPPGCGYFFESLR
jgi:hypothetical protein